MDLFQVFFPVAGAVLLRTFVSSVAGVIFYSTVPINGAVAEPDWLLGILFGAGGFLGMYFDSEKLANTINYETGIIIAGLNRICG